MSYNPKGRKPKPEELAFMADVKGLLAKHGQNMGADQMLAVASVLVGQLIALQDQTKWNAAQVMHFVKVNIEAGNAGAIEDLLGNTKCTG